jgi:Domain of unknown function (DUF4331)
MRKAPLALGLAAGIAALAAVILLRAPSPQAGNASSHREAPLISEDPTADNTDLYAFRSPDSPEFLTLISNLIPAEDPAAGPNYYRFSQGARYLINLDRNGDGKADVTYAFRFKSADGPLFLGNTVQSYTVTRTIGHSSRVIARGMTPPDNIGPRTLKQFYGTSDYRALAAQRVSSLDGGGKVFAGQRDDAFFADIGAIFDLVAIRKGFDNGGKDFFAGYAVHTLALQIPISQIDTKSHVVGVWTSTERKAAYVRKHKLHRGWVQVSRLGNPLVNEVVIPTKLKDRWNRLTPATDRRFSTYYENPILAAVINQLYGVGAPEHNRDDLVQVLLTGVPGLNNTGTTRADELRINLAIPPKPRGTENRLGVLGNDLAGFPNGRRLTDDVVDIAERAVAGALKGNNVPLGDGVNADDKATLPVFPYEPDPESGADNTKGR